jgi:hypothetical protein
MPAPHVFLPPCCRVVLTDRVARTSKLGMRGSFSQSRWSSVLQTVRLKRCCFTLWPHRSISVRTKRHAQFPLICQSIFSLCISSCVVLVADVKDLSSGVYVHGYSTTQHNPNHRTRHFQRLFRRIFCCPGTPPIHIPSFRY